MYIALELKVNYGSNMHILAYDLQQNLFPLSTANSLEKKHKLIGSQEAGS